MIVLRMQIGNIPMQAGHTLCEMWDIIDSDTFCWVLNELIFINQLQISIELLLYLLTELAMININIKWFSDEMFVLLLIVVWITTLEQLMQR